MNHKNLEDDCQPTIAFHWVRIVSIITNISNIIVGVIVVVNAIVIAFLLLLLFYRYIVIIRVFWRINGGYSQ